MKYCYANYSIASVKNNYARHDPKSPLLIGNLEANDKVNERKLRVLSRISFLFLIFAYL